MRRGRTEREAAGRELEKIVGHPSFMIGGKATTEDLASYRVTCRAEPPAGRP